MIDDLSALVGEDLEDEVTQTEDTTPPWDEPETTTSVVESQPERPVRAANVPNFIGELQLGKEKYSTLIDVLNFVQNLCDDFVVSNGFTRAVANDRSTILNVDFTGIFSPDTELILSQVSKKYALLDLFKKQQVEMYLDIQTNKYQFRDSMSKFVFEKPAIDYLNTPALSESDLATRIGADTNRRILSCTLNKMILDRITSGSKSLQCELLLVDFSDGKCTFKMSPADQNASMYIDLLSFQDELDETDLSGVAPFAIKSVQAMLYTGVDEIKVDLYHSVRGEDILSMRFSCALQISGTDIKIPIEAWALAQLVNP